MCAFIPSNHTSQHMHIIVILLIVFQLIACQSSTALTMGNIKVENIKVEYGLKVDHPLQKNYDDTLNALKLIKAEYTTLESKQKSLELNYSNATHAIAKLEILMALRLCDKRMTELEHMHGQFSIAFMLTSAVIRSGM